MDLSRFADTFIVSVSTEVTKSGTLTVRIDVGEAGGKSGVLVASEVDLLRIDGSDLNSFIGEAVVRRLPRTGAWPPEARHLLGHHDNVAEKTWLRLSGPTTIEILANIIVAESETAAEASGT